MEKHIQLIDEYLAQVHSAQRVQETLTKEPSEEKFPNQSPKEVKEERVPLDMKLLQQRIDSVSVIKYYKDLKNERLRDDNVKVEDTADDIFNAIQSSNDNKPWPKLDNYTKRKKIGLFVENLFSQKKIDCKKTVEEELLKMLADKKITKKTIDFDANNNIIRLVDYSLE